MAEQKGQNQPKQQDVNQLLQIRREKLADLQSAGKDPFEITKYDVTHHSTDVKELYNAHEAELLAGRQAPEVDGLDEAQKREVLNNDYNERRAIMDASPIHVSIAGRMMFKRVFTDPAGEVPWTDRYRYEVSAALCGSDHESGE